MARSTIPELEALKGLNLFQFLVSSGAQLTYSLGMLHGAVTQRLQHGVTANEPIMAAIRELSEATSRRDKTTFEMQLALVDQLSRVQTDMTAMNDNFVEALANFERTAWLAESRSLEDARSQLIRALAGKPHRRAAG